MPIPHPLFSRPDPLLDPRARQGRHSRPGSVASWFRGGARRVRWSDRRQVDGAARHRAPRVREIVPPVEPHPGLPRQVRPRRFVPRGGGARGVASTGTEPQVQERHPAGRQGGGYSRARVARVRVVPLVQCRRHCHVRSAAPLGPEPLVERSRQQGARIP